MENMNNIICKIADFDEICKKWDYEISIHPNEEKWVIWKNESIACYNKNNRLCYIGILNGEIITEATAMLSSDGVQNADSLVNADTAYLCAFRTRKEYRGQGYFSQLYHYMENDLYHKGYRTLTIGVELNDFKNKTIYKKYGFTEYIKTDYEIEPPEKDGEEPHKIMVEYYRKEIV